MDQKKIRMLVIDDEKEFCSLLKEHFQVAGRYNVIIAAGGRVGPWLFQHDWHKPDIILLDLNMPVMDGFEMLEHIKTDQRTAHIPTIVITGRTDDEAKEKVLSIGCDGYMNKPVSLVALKSHVEKLVGGKR